MKSKVFSLVITFLFGIIFMIAISCKKSIDSNDSKDVLWEISLSDDNKIIENSIENIGFKFCLLNEQGEPAKIFNKEENFSFSFSVTNNGYEELYFDPGFAHSQENGFCRVYNSINQDLGKSFIFLGYDKYDIETVK